MSVLMRRENTLIIEPGSDISKIQIINFILLPNSKKHFEGPPLYNILTYSFAEPKDRPFYLIKNEFDTKDSYQIEQFQKEMKRRIIGCNGQQVISVCAGICDFCYTGFNPAYKNIFYPCQLKQIPTIKSIYEIEIQLLMNLEYLEIISNEKYLLIHIQAKLYHFNSSYQIHIQHTNCKH
ncbi:Conserved_hypothetical protein [Hexamita inflata]|uniref:Uncharacterized protein n=1 Tax=Hexamita inflata TaxID=28002 RepID=A0AA86UZN0_9EUKA|nr:Conserved hypothetical protein [Hexamita inflata]